MQKVLGHAQRVPLIAVLVKGFAWKCRVFRRSPSRDTPRPQASGPVRTSFWRDALCEIASGTPEDLVLLLDPPGSAPLLNEPVLLGVVEPSLIPSPIRPGPLTSTAQTPDIEVSCHLWHGDLASTSCGHITLQPLRHILGLACIPSNTTSPCAKDVYRSLSTEGPIAGLRCGLYC